MLTRPQSCNGCPLHTIAEGFAYPEGEPKLGVVLMGEALGEQEAKLGRPFIGPAGLRLERMVQRAGYSRSDFQIINTISCRPPNNQFSPENPYFQPAMERCRQYWEPQVRRPEVKVVVPMGNTGLEATLGHRGILSRRGYVEWSESLGAFVLPTVHPSYIMRGNSNWEAAWIYDVRHAVQVASEGWEPVDRDYALDPNPLVAMAWAQRYASLGVLPDLTVDIETPDKSAAEDETDINLGYQAGPIFRVGFAYVDPLTKRTQCLSIPFEASYRAVIELLLHSARVLVFCYRHFDVPRLRAHGLELKGEVVDVQEAWHVLHSDLPKKLEHMAPFLVPRQFAWKHLSGEQPAYYNAIDVGVQIEAWVRVRELLAEAGMLDLYERDIRQLNPILIYMNTMGMPINAQKRLAASQQLLALKEESRTKLNAAAEGARPQKVYKKKPKAEGVYTEVPLDAVEKYCSACGKVRVNKKHPCFKPGGGGELLERSVTVVGWAKPLDFKPSQKGLLRYAQFRGYRIITKWDRPTQTRKPVMDENALRRYALQHPEDPVFPLALEERELTKLLGTYVGRVTDEPEKPETPEQAWHRAWAAAQYRRDEEGQQLPPPKTVDLGSNGKVYDLDDSEIPF